MKIEFTIPGDPYGKGRPRFTGTGRTYTPAKTSNYENLVKLAFAEKYPDFVPLEGEIVLLVKAYKSIPKSATKKRHEAMAAGKIKPTSKPDYDNIGKTVSDALNKLCYHDDAQIVDGRVMKFYSETPRVEVYISTGDETE